MNLSVRLLLVLAVVVAALAVAWRFTPHHSDPNPFMTLYAHLVPAELVKDTHVEHGQAEPLVALAVPGFLGLFTLDSALKPTGVLRLYNLQIFQVAAILMILVVFLGVPQSIRSRGGDVVGRVFTGFALWVRDEMVYPNLGKELGRRFLPYFLTLFFFLLFLNLFGLIPGGATATASIFVTAAMALLTLAMMIGGGMLVQGPLAFWKHLVPHVPAPLWPLMFAVELLGLFVKPFALMVRLFANMNGGHMVVLSFMGLIFFFAKTQGTSVGYLSAPIAVGFGVFIMIIESFVALLQAYIFTQLSILFVGAALHPEH